MKVSRRELNTKKIIGSQVHSSRPTRKTGLSSAAHDGDEIRSRPRSIVLSGAACSFMLSASVDEVRIIDFLTNLVLRGPVKCIESLTFLDQEGTGWFGLRKVLRRVLSFLD